MKVSNGINLSLGGIKFHVSVSKQTRRSEGPYRLPRWALFPSQTTWKLGGRHWRPMTLFSPRNLFMWQDHVTYSSFPQDSGLGVYVQNHRFEQLKGEALRPQKLVSLETPRVWHHINFTWRAKLLCNDVKPWYTFTIAFIWTFIPREPLQMCR